MHGILGKSWELHVPHFQRLVNDPRTNVNTWCCSDAAHMLMVCLKKYGYVDFLIL